MKPAAFAYAKARSLDDAVELLSGGRDGEARVLAGGQSLMATLNMRLDAPRLLVDINGIPGLDGITRKNGAIEIGALVRQSQAERSALIAEAAPLIAKALPHIGHRAIRNRGTLAGSIAFADPAAELPACLLALGGEVDIADPNGARTVKADDFFRGLFETALGPHDVITAIRVPAATAATRTGFAEFARRHGDYAMAGLAASAHADDRAGGRALGVFRRRVNADPRSACRSRAQRWRNRRDAHRCGRRRARERSRPARRHPSDERGQAAPRRRAAAARYAPTRGDTMSARIDITLTVNGETVHESVEPRKSLVDFLREDLGLTGSHVGCEHGVCGACTVRVDGQIVRGCLMLAVQCDGARVETIEGLADSGEIDDLRAAFETRNALQCGYCTPGILMTMKAFLDSHPKPTEPEVREALSGNLCRCTGYQHIVDAVLLAAERMGS